MIWLKYAGEIVVSKKIIMQTNINWVGLRSLVNKGIDAKFNYIPKRKVFIHENTHKEKDDVIVFDIFYSGKRIKV